MMVQIASDLHLEFFKDSKIKNNFLLSFNSAVDVLILAGDIFNFCDIQRIESSLNDLQLLCDNYKNIVYVTGNHEYYCSTSNKVHDILSNINNQNFFWLNNSYTIIKNQRFIGCTLWFKEDKSAPEFINDFNVIYDFRSFAFDMNAESHKYLLNNVNEQDIVITHHLPTKKSISARWLNYNNYGFVHDADQIITENKPKIWIHGHTHDSKDYMYGETRILCNPYGYHKYEQNKDYQSLILEI